MPTGTILERFLDERRAAGRISSTLIPAPGQYLLAHDPASYAPLPVALFPAGTAADGFLVAPPLPHAWLPGQTLTLRGPLGRGFRLPASARKVALVAWKLAPAVLLALLAPALAQNASLALLCDDPPDDLPSDVEVQPLEALPEVFAWADYVALHVERESLAGVVERLGSAAPARGPQEAEVLVGAPVPCGGLAECGVCAVHVKNEVRLACKDGPVFRYDEVKRLFDIWEV